MNPDESLKLDPTIKFRYAGSSMRSTFQPGQVIYVHPKADGIRPGDIIVYRRGKEYIVHRVNSLNQDGIHTRGDNNFQEDENPISPDQIVGVVDKAEDFHGVHPVLDGKKGLWISRTRWWINDKYQRALPWLGAPYRWLKAQGWIAKIWHPQIVKLQVKTQNGTVIKYLAQGKTVAVWDCTQKLFFCCKPYDLVIFPPGEEK